MSVEVTIIRAQIYLTLAPGFSFKSDFRYPQRKKYKELTAGKHGSQVISPSSPITCMLDPTNSMEVVKQSNRNMCWRTS
ncbi:hypothetical protein TNCV_2096701 [Trichonephila clavipes]|nr:hypothetical protein TNCV_2096701 [Trichonephila clavipes]